MGFVTIFSKLFDTMQNLEQQWKQVLLMNEDLHRQSDKLSRELNVNEYKIRNGTVFLFYR